VLLLLLPILLLLLLLSLLLLVQRQLRGRLLLVLLLGGGGQQAQGSQGGSSWVGPGRGGARMGAEGWSRLLEVRDHSLVFWANTGLSGLGNAVDLGVCEVQLLRSFFRGVTGKQIFFHYPLLAHL